jgi:hypothetical protein
MAQFDEEQQRRAQIKEIFNDIDRARLYLENAEASKTVTEEEHTLHAMRHALSHAMVLASNRIQAIRPPMVYDASMFDLRLSTIRNLVVKNGAKITDLIDVDKLEEILKRFAQDEEERE